MCCCVRFHFFFFINCPTIMPHDWCIGLNFVGNILDQWFSVRFCNVLGQLNENAINGREKGRKEERKRKKNCVIAFVRLIYSNSTETHFFFLFNDHPSYLHTHNAHLYLISMPNFHISSPRMDVTFCDYLIVNTMPNETHTYTHTHSIGISSGKKAKYYPKM